MGSAQCGSPATHHYHCSVVSRNTAFAALPSSLKKAGFLRWRRFWTAHNHISSEFSTFVAAMAGPVQGCASSFVQAVHTHTVVQALPQPAQVAWKNFTLVKNTRKRLLFPFCSAFKSISSFISSHLWWINQQFLKQDLPTNALSTVHLHRGPLRSSNNIHF